MAASFAVMNQPSGAESSSASSLTGYDVIHLYVMIFTKLSQQASDRVAPVVDGFRTIGYFRKRGIKYARHFTNYSETGY
jgi:hypothetical protein